MSRENLSWLLSQYLPPYLADHHERMTGSCICLDTFMQGTSERPSNVDVLRCSRLKNAERDSDPSALGLRFHSSVPIYAGNTLLGVMNVASEDWRELDYKELQLLHLSAIRLVSHCNAPASPQNIHAPLPD